MGNTTEEELGKKWDNCMYNAMVKMVGGLAIGAVASVLMFRSQGKRWPLVLGVGFGLGFAYAQCQKDMNDSLSIKAGQKASNT